LINHHPAKTPDYGVRLETARRCRGVFTQAGIRGTADIRKAETLLERMTDDDTPREVRWERMFPEALEEAFARCPVLYLPYGLCEPHGPHNAVGLDTLKVHALACASARAHGGIVAPPSHWHIHDFGPTAWFGHFHIGDVERTWITAVPPWLFYKTVLYHVRMADVLGFEVTVLLTGHWTAVADDLERLVRLVQPYVGTRLAGLGDWSLSGEGIDHAGRIETSLLWALEPECVDMSRLDAVDESGLNWAMGADAAAADRSFGEGLVRASMQSAALVVSELRADYAREKPEHLLRSYEQVETLWTEVVRPALPEFGSAAEGSQGEADVPRTSRWVVNWRPGFSPP
jgi:creatinine amidohydrolase